MLRVLLLTGIIAFVSPLFGQTSSPSAAPSLEQRVADLEAYITNSPRGVDMGSASSSNIAAPGPSYNAWIMTCAALVLFMTLPGLALFYGCLLYTSDAADERSSVDLGGRRIIKKKKK